MRCTNLFVSVSLVSGTLAAAGAESAPPTRGLVLRLDPSDRSTIETDATGRVTRWRDKSSGHRDAVPATTRSPVLLPDVFQGRPALRFSGKEALRVPALADSPGNLTIFTVYQRPADQASDKKWQRVLSCWDGKSDGDHRTPSFAVTMSDAGSLPPTVRCDLLANRHRGEVWIGGNMKYRGGSFRGDIAEILIYDFGFLVDEQVQEVRRYLREKWGVPENPDEAWTRVGILPAPPNRATDKLPLSDQENKDNWEPYKPLWDEFDGKQLAASKWWDHNPRWYGRAPSRYLAGNVRVSDGMMHITMKRDDSLPHEKLYKNGPEYHSYSAGSVVAKGPVLYGYFEIRCRAMSSAGSSAFWFSARMKDLATGKPYRSEIDVFEIGGLAPGHETKFHMNAHIFEIPTDGARHWSKGGTWDAPFRFADNFHVVALEWAPDFITYFVDGVPVRRMKNTHWHAPMFLIFDSETMGDWLGMPKGQDLPSTFSIDYIRAWKNDATRGQWRNKFAPYQDPAESTPITHYVREMARKGW